MIDELAAIGILKQVKGDRWKCTTAQKFFRAMQRASAGMNVETVKTYTLKQSFMALGKELELPFKPSTSDVQFINEGREVIILKKGEGSQLLDYKDEDFLEAERFRKQVNIINDMLENAGY